MCQNVSYKHKSVYKKNVRMKPDLSKRQMRSRSYLKYDISQRSQ